MAAGLSLSAYGQTTLKIFDRVLFFDGYAAKVDTPAPAGTTMLRNDLFTTKLSELQLFQIGTDLKMDVVIHAACDNYDRIGNVNLAFVPKGDTSYVPKEVDRIELGRFITPFMNKNAKLDSVPYHFEISNIAHILKEESIRKKYDLWMELEVFGVPYAAQTQVSGCKGRNDVFYGTLTLVTDGSSLPEQNNVIYPMAFKADFNNYQQGATDEIGVAVKTINVQIDKPLTDAYLYIITSNHGANAGGEEYNRRVHYIHWDGTEVLNYTPGRQTCEPFRKYNTQGNGIYGPTRRTDEEWQSFSNWCPGDVITTRKVHLGSVGSGQHSFRISVPDALFADQQGYIPLTVYVQGVTQGTLNVEDKPAMPRASLSPNPATGLVTITADEPVAGISLLDFTGKVVRTSSDESIDLSQLPSGIYLARISFASGLQVMRKVVKE